jgi:hypothetical protein
VGETVGTTGEELREVVEGGEEGVDVGVMGRVKSGSSLALEAGVMVGVSTRGDEALEEDGEATGGVTGGGGEMGACSRGATDGGEEVEASATCWNEIEELVVAVHRGVAMRVEIPSYSLRQLRHCSQEKWHWMEESREEQWQWLMRRRLWLKHRTVARRHSLEEQRQRQRRRARARKRVLRRRCSCGRE